MTIYEIDKAILALQDENGEIGDWEALDALAMERDRKIENVACWYKELMAEAGAIQDEERTLAERRQKTLRKAERLKEYMVYALQGQKFATARCAVGYRSSTATVLDDEERALKWLKRKGFKNCYTVKTTLQKTGIADLLKRDVAVPGAHLEQKTNLIIK